MSWFLSLVDSFMAWYNTKTVPSLDSVSTITLTTMPPQTPPVPQNAPIAPVLDWETQKGTYHAVRVTCDNLRLTLEEKNLICACIYQESRFTNTATHQNKDASGNILSTDWGLCQVNDWYHIGAGKDFPSVIYVVDNPEKVVEWMVGMYKHGLLKQWVSFSSQAYLTWLKPNSPMWLLAS